MATDRKGKEVDVHMIDKVPKRPRGITSAYTSPIARSYHQQVQLPQAFPQAFNQRQRPDQPRYPRGEPQKFSPLPIAIVELYIYVLEKKLVTPLFMRSRDNPSLANFDPSKKCENLFEVEGHTLEECWQMRNRI